MNYKSILIVGLFLYHPLHNSVRGQEGYSAMEEPKRMLGMSSSSAEIQS